MPADELLAAIERAEGKREAFLAELPDAKVSFKLLARLPQAAALYRKQIVEGLSGDPRAAAKARVILRELFGGEIRLQPQRDGGLLARWNLQPAALLRGAGTFGSGGSLREYPTAASSLIELVSRVPRSCDCLRKSGRNRARSVAFGSQFSPLPDIRQLQMKRPASSRASSPGRITQTAQPHPQITIQSIFFQWSTNCPAAVATMPSFANAAIGGSPGI